MDGLLIRTYTYIQDKKESSQLTQFYINSNAPIQFSSNVVDSLQSNTEVRIPMQPNISRTNHPELPSPIESQSNQRP